MSILDFIFYKAKPLSSSQIVGLGSVDLMTKVDHLLISKNSGNIVGIGETSPLFSFFRKHSIV